MTQSIPHGGIFLSPSLLSYISKSGGSGLSGVSVDACILEITKHSRRDLLGTLQGFDHSLDLLEKAMEATQSSIAILEEAGGLCVRARNYAQENNGETKYAEKLKELDGVYQKAIAKLNSHVKNWVSDGSANLLVGDSLSTVFDPEGHSTLITQGISLLPEDLGIRDPDFSTLHSIQNSRIDITNSIDLAVTLRNIISADISTIKTRREFCEIAMSLLTKTQDYLASSSSLEEPSAYLEMCRNFVSPADGGALAEEEQLMTLTSFKTP